MLFSRKAGVLQVPRFRPRILVLTLAICGMTLACLSLQSGKSLQNLLTVPEFFVGKGLLDATVVDPASNTSFTAKPVTAFRDYSIDDDDPIKRRVKRTYYEMHTHQTLEFATRKLNESLKFNKFSATVMEALERLNQITDESDPDVDMPNFLHAYQTAEKLRELHPDKDWLHLTGLVHDLGKVLAFYEPQWAVVGDTFPLGCKFAKSIVYREKSFDLNPDLHDARYNTKYGIYYPNSGLENVVMSWGHDEYMYRILVNHNSSLPEEALYIIRFHSFYPWHTGGDYLHLCNKKDLKMLQWVRVFNKFDLYTKSETSPNIAEIQPYYQSLIDKYIPGVVQW